MSYFLCVIGMVMIVEGVPYFAFPEKMKQFIEQILEMNEGSLRKMGFGMLIIGLFLVFIGRP